MRLYAVFLARVALVAVLVTISCLLTIFIYTNQHHSQRQQRQLDPPKIIDDVISGGVNRSTSSPASTPPPPPTVKCHPLPDLSAYSVFEDLSGLVQRPQCADDVDVLAEIELCHHIKPRLLSSRSVNRNSRGVSGCFIVPNIVHYVIISKVDYYGKPRPQDRPMSFLQYLSFLSVEQHIKPRYILIHGDALPYGEWWRRTTANVPNIYLVNTTDWKVPTHVYGVQLLAVEHRADIHRYRILYEFGGIYIDPDVLVFKSFDPLRKYRLTLGLESDKQPSPYLSNGIIVGQPGALFLRLWQETYRTYKHGEWAQHSVRVPGKLWELFPSLVHVENQTLIYPIWSNRDLLYDPHHKYDWSGQYSCHVWRRQTTVTGAVPASPDPIDQLDTVLGQMMRFIYYGRKDIRDSGKIGSNKSHLTVVAVPLKI